MLSLITGFARNKDCSVEPEHCDVIFPGLQYKEKNASSLTLPQMTERVKTLHYYGDIKLMTGHTILYKIWKREVLKIK